MLLAGAAAADNSALITAIIQAFSAIAVAGISAWAAVQVSRATKTQQTTVADLQEDKAELEQRVKELEKGRTE